MMKVYQLLLMCLLLPICAEAMDNNSLLLKLEERVLNQKRMIKAIEENNVELIETLLEEGFEPESCDDNGNPFLVLAMKHDSYECAEILFEAVKDTLQQDSEGKTAFIIAVEKDNKALFELFFTGNDCYETLFPLTCFWNEHVKSTVGTIDCKKLIKMALEHYKSNSKYAFFTLDRNDLNRSNLHEQQKTHCGTTARLLVALLTGKMIKKGKKYIFDNKEYKFLHNDIFRGTFEEFSRINQSCEPINPLFKKLFPQPEGKKKQHLLFYIDVCEGKHLFLVEKMSGVSSGVSVLYRIYMSSLQYFTLEEWLDNKELPLKAKSYEALKNSIGEGKWVGYQLVLEYIKNLCIVAHDPTVNSYQLTVIAFEL